MRKERERRGERKEKEKKREKGERKGREKGEERGKGRVKGGGGRERRGEERKEERGRQSKHTVHCSERAHSNVHQKECKEEQSNRKDNHLAVCVF